MRRYLSLICLIILSSQAFCQNIDLESDIIYGLRDFEIREISIRKAVIRDDYLTTVIGMLESNKNKDSLPLDPIIIPNKDPINKFDEILLFRYMTKFGVKEEAKVLDEVKSIFKIASKMASRENIKLISIRPTRKIIQANKIYYAEKDILYFRLENGEWEIEVLH